MALRMIVLAGVLAWVGCERAASPTATATPTVTPTVTPTATATLTATATASDARVVRAEIAAGFLSGDAARLRLPTKWKFDAPRARGTIVGMTVRPKSERAMTKADVDRLAELLRAPDGFNDDIRKRCAMGPLVGFRVVRKAPGAAAEETVEVAVDFVCSKLFVTVGADSGVPGKAHWSHFDPSRAAFLDLAQRALPDDTELEKIR